MKKTLLSLLLVVSSCLGQSSYNSNVSSNTFKTYTNTATANFVVVSNRVVNLTFYVNANSNSIVDNINAITINSNSIVINSNSVVINSNLLASVNTGLNTYSNNNLTLLSSAKVGAGTASLNASAIIQADSTSKGLLPPRMTKAQRDAITKVDGLMLYQTDNTQGLKVVVSNAWYNVTLTADP